MISKERKKEAEKNFFQYLQEGIIKKEKNELSKEMYIKNADLSLNLSEECMKSTLGPYIWVVVMSYYSMFYIANAVLLELGYKTSNKIVHRVTNDALIVLVMDKRSRFQYNMTESIQEQKAKTSLKRAKEFIFEMKKLLPTKE